jgi:2',3'-cyclic-nucleotide 2'-phosphodiesterase (5'-nucleotidase family)
MTHRRQFITQLTMAVGAASILRPFNVFGFCESQGPIVVNTLTILHTTDLNGQIHALPLTDKLYGLGGLELLTKAVRGLKYKTAATLSIHAGNITDTRRQNREECLSIYKSLSDAGYDVIVPGASDLARGKEYFNQLATESELPFLTPGISGSNLPCDFVMKGPFRIGIINAVASKNRSFSLQASAITKTAISLKAAKQCSIVICLLPRVSKAKHHLLAKLSSSVDVMLASAEKLSIHNTEIELNRQGQEVIISYAGAKGTTVSRLELTFDNQKERRGFASSAFFVGAMNESITSLMKQYKLTYV